MSLYAKVVDGLQDNQQKRRSGEIIAIPWDLPRLSEVLPGIEKGRYNVISASLKAGKTQLADFLYVYQPLEWLVKHPQSNIKLKIFYFSLEVSKEAKIKAAICYKLFKEYGVIISPQKLSSTFQNYILEDEILELINKDEFKKWFDTFEQVVTIHDNIRNPYGIFNVIKTYAEQNGKYTYRDYDFQNLDGTYVKKKAINSYIPNEKDEYVIIIVDHISLLQPEKQQTLHQAIGKYSSEYCLEMRDKWNYIPVIVQQQSADSTKAQFTYRGDTIVDKIKPDPEGLADNKYTSRDVDLMLSLFYPYRYNIETYKGLDLTLLKDNHREFMINLNRNGISNASIQLFFLGSSSYFAELPRKMDEEDYSRVESLNNKII